MILGRIFEGNSNGFYIDVGAHHPVRFSNTYRFYQMGWRGINIDATPGSMKSFVKMRPRDINLEVLIAEEEKDIDFYIMNEPALNTTDRQYADEVSASTKYCVTSVLKIPARRLENILESHIPARLNISFLTIDVEGADIQVLRSNDWRRFRPEVVLVESLGYRLSEIDKDPVCSFLLRQDYQPFAGTMNTMFFRYTS